MAEEVLDKAEQLAKFLHNSPVSEDTRGLQSEMGKIISFLRRYSKEGSGTGKKLDKLLEALVHSQKEFSHSNRTISYFETIQAARDEVLPDVADGEQLLRIFGWARCLMAAYGELSPDFLEYRIAQSKQGTSRKQTATAHTPVSPFAKLAALKSDPPDEPPAKQDPAQQSSPSPATKVKTGDKLTVSITAVLGKSCEASYEDVRVKFEIPYGRPLEPGMKVDVQLLSEQSGIWKAKFKAYR